MSLKRLPRQRRPETLQRWRARTLEPRLTFVNLLPFELDEEGNAEPLGELDDVASVQLCEAFKRVFVPRPIEERPVAFFQFVFQFQRRDPPHLIPKLVSLYRDVRGLLERLPRMMPPRDALAPGYEVVQEQVEHLMGVGADGRLYDQPE